MASPILSAQHITKRYAAHTALSDVSVDVPQGSIFGLLGPNGAGKTSLIRIITQITGPDEGALFFNGQPLRPEHVTQMGYLPEERGLYKKMKVGEQLLYLARLKGLSRAEATSRVKEWFERLEIGSWWNKNIEDLSKGMQQKVQFVATVVHEPSLIILDEPFSGFDPVNAAAIRDEMLRLRDQGRTLIFSTHRMESVEELCDHIALINKSKKVLDGPTQAIRQQHRTQTFVVEGQGHLSELDPTYEVVSLDRVEEENFKAHIRIPTGSTANRLLAELINQVEVLSFRESLPSMNDIFIRSVSEAGEAISTVQGLTE